MNDVFISFDWSEYFAHWAFYIFQVKLGAAYETIPHIFDEVLKVDDF